MAKYYHLKIKEVTNESEDAVTIHFWHPWNEVIRYIPGQYFTVLWPNETGDKIRRSYSLSSSPFTDVSPAITVKRVAGGLVSEALVSNAKEGDILEVMQAMGTFSFTPDPEKERTIFLLATGSGITPLLSIAKSVLIVEPESKVVLLYGNRKKEDIIFKAKIDELQAKYHDRFQVVHSLTAPSPDWSGETGRLTPQKMLDLLLPLKEGVTAPGSVFFICGQEDFMDAARQTLLELGADKNAIHTESFVIHKDLEALEPEFAEADDDLQTREITLRYEGTEHKLQVAPHQSVLEAALSQEIDLPYSCQAGMCTACLGRVLHGEVVLDEYDALSEAEVKEGFILTCVAHPKSNDVFIEVE